MTRRRLRAAGFLLGLAGLVLAVVETADDFDGTVRPTNAALAGAAALAVVSLVAAGRSWARLLGVSDAERPAVVGALYLSQLSKYLPAGGLLQAAGQVSMSAGARIPVVRAAVAFPIAALEVVVSGAALSAGLAATTEIPGWARVAAAVAPAGYLLLHPRLLRSLLGLASRVTSRVPDVSNVPPGSTILGSTMWATVNMTATSLAFALLIGSVAPGSDGLASFSAFAGAWVIGFLVVPIPSGLGIREAILLVAVPGLDPAEILAASLAHRVVTLFAEVAATAVNAWIRRRRHDDDDALAGAIR